MQYQQALKILQDTLGEDHPSLAYPLVGLTRIHLEQREPGMARECAERAISILTANGTTHEKLAEAQFLLARTLWHEPTRRAQARALATQARDDFAASGRARKDELTEAEQWLAEHQVR